METKLEIKGMTCGHCVSAVEKALMAVPGVTEVIEVSLERGEACIRSEAAPQQLIEAVTSEGYEARVK
jgi:copper chaperone